MNQESRNVLWEHSTKKHEIFIREPGSEARCITIDELTTILKPGMQWMGELIPEHKALVTAAGVESAILRPIEEVLPKFLKGQEYSSQILQPWYGRGW